MHLVVPQHVASGELAIAAVGADADVRVPASPVDLEPVDDHVVGVVEVDADWPAVIGVARSRDDDAGVGEVRDGPAFDPVGLVNEAGALARADSDGVAGSDPTGGYLKRQPVPAGESAKPLLALLPSGRT